MRRIEIPNKTFTLYRNGTRTFVHIPSENGEVLTLTYGEEIVLVNKETKEELNQIFWFHYKLKSIPRFQFLVFEWSIKTPLFFQRKARALQATEECLVCSNSRSISINSFSNEKKLLYHQLQAFSSFFFMSDEYYIEGQTVEFNSIVYSFERNVSHHQTELPKNCLYIIVDTLKIKKNPNEEESDTFQFYSVFPISLLQ